MRKIVVEFELPEEIEDDYRDVHPQLVFEDLFPSQIGFRVISDTAQLGAEPNLLCRFQNCKERPEVDGYCEDHAPAPQSC